VESEITFVSAVAEADRGVRSFGIPGQGLETPTPAATPHASIVDQLTQVALRRDTSNHIGQ